MRIISTNVAETRTVIEQYTNFWEHEGVEITLCQMSGQNILLHRRISIQIQ